MKKIILSVCFLAILQSVAAGGHQKLSFRDYYEVSGKDFRLQNSTEDIQEQKIFNDINEADINSNDSITYMEYLNWLSEKGYYVAPRLEKEVAMGLNEMDFRTMEFCTDGTLKCTEVDGMADINGILFMYGQKVWFKGNWAINSFTLDEETEIDGIKYKKSSFISLNPDDQVMEGVLAENMIIQVIAVNHHQRRWL